MMVTAPTRRRMSEVKKGMHKGRRMIVNEFQVNWDKVRRLKSADPEHRFLEAATGFTLNTDVPAGTAVTDLGISEHDINLATTGLMPWEHSFQDGQKMLQNVKQMGDTRKQIVTQTEALSAKQQDPNSSADEDENKEAVKKVEEEAKKITDQQDPLQGDPDQKDVFLILKGLGLGGAIPQEIPESFPCDSYPESHIAEVSDHDNDGDLNEANSVLKQVSFKDACKKKKVAQAHAKHADNIIFHMTTEYAQAKIACELKARVLRKLFVTKEFVHPMVRELARVPQEHYDEFTGEVVKSKRMLKIEATLASSLVGEIEDAGADGKKPFTCNANNEVEVIKQEGADLWGPDYDEEDFEFLGKDQPDDFEKKFDALKYSEELDKDTKKELINLKAKYKELTTQLFFNMFKDPTVLTKKMSQKLGQSKRDTLRQHIEDWGKDEDKSCARVPDYSEMSDSVQKAEMLKIAQDQTKKENDKDCVSDADCKSYNCKVITNTPLKKECKAEVVVDSDSDGIPDAVEMAECLIRMVNSNIVPRVSKELMEDVRAGKRSQRDVADVVRPTCVLPGKTPLKGKEVKKMLIDLQTEDGNGRTAYNYCAELEQHFSGGATASATLAGAAPTHADFDEDHCDFIFQCGDQELQQSAANKAVKDARVRMRKQRRLEVLKARRRQLKEEPNRKLTVRELEADKWYERGIRYLVEAPKTKLSAFHKSRNDKKMFWHNMRKKNMRSLSRKNKPDRKSVV